MITEKIEKFKADLQAKGKFGLALDIDEVLSNTILYWLEAMFAKFGNPENLTIEQMVEKYRYTQNVPYWQTEEILAWMEAKRHDSSIHEDFKLIENANHFANKLNQKIPVVAYLTGRPDTVFETTQNWLNKHGFPEAELITKPNHINNEQVNKWKAEVLNYLYPQVKGIVDDNPGLLKNLDSSYKGIVFLYDHAEYPVQDFKVAPCKTWVDLLQAVENNLEYLK